MNRTPEEDYNIILHSRAILDYATTYGLYSYSIHGVCSISSIQRDIIIIFKRGVYPPLYSDMFSDDVICGLGNTFEDAIVDAEPALMKAINGGNTCL